MNDTPYGRGISRGLLGTAIVFFLLNVMAGQGVSFLNDSLSAVLITSAAAGAVTGFFACHRARIRALEQQVESLAQQIEKLKKAT